MSFQPIKTLHFVNSTIAGINSAPRFSNLQFNFNSPQNIDLCHIDFKNYLQSPTPTSRINDQLNNPKMPRSSRSGGGSRPARAGAPLSGRPTVPAAKPAPVQTRPATTAAMPSSQYGRPNGPPAAPGQQHQTSGVPAVPQTGGGGGGMLSNIVSTGM